VYSHFTYSWSLEALEVGYLKASKKAQGLLFSRIFVMYVAKVVTI
jgi:hypothetical protein